MTLFLYFENCSLLQIEMARCQSSHAEPAFLEGRGWGGGGKIIYYKRKHCTQASSFSSVALASNDRCLF